jgi:hypothetical protein
MIKSGRIRWAGHEVLMGETGYEYKILVVKHEEKRPLRHLGVAGRLSKLILGKQG